MKLVEIIEYLEIIAPLSYQADYDNSGLLVGDLSMDVNSVLTCLDCTEEIIDEAIKKSCNLIISHHPVIFHHLKKINNSNAIERVIFKSIQNNIAIYCMHTNLDNIENGVSFTLSKKLDLLNTEILKVKESNLCKLITYCPKSHQNKLEHALFEEGAGKVGSKYDQCSFSSLGQGGFRPLSKAKPYVGEKHKRSLEEEVKIELIFPSYLESKLLKSLFQNHPYEEVAYQIINIHNSDNTIGSGVIGDLKNKMTVRTFFNLLNQVMPHDVLKYTACNLNKPIKKIAFCGGSGYFLLGDAISKKADIYISSDFKYHNFFEAENKIIIVDIGHYETEQFVPNLISDILKKKFPKLAVVLTQINTNPVIYYKNYGN